MVLDAPEVYLSQINASDCTVVHGAIVDDTVCHICGRCPLGGTWNIGRNLAEGKLDAYGYIKVIQYLKTLENGFLCGILWWCRSLVERAVASIPMYSTLYFSVSLRMDSA